MRSAPKLFAAKLFEKNQGGVILLFRLSSKYKVSMANRAYIISSIQFEDIFNFNSSLN